MDQIVTQSRDTETVTCVTKTCTGVGGRGLSWSRRLRPEGWWELVGEGGERVPSIGTACAKVLWWWREQPWGGSTGTAGPEEGVNASGEVSFAVCKDCTVCSAKNIWVH